MKEHQLKILQGLASGKTPAIIAGELELSPRTIETYVLNLRRIYKANTAAHLVAIALRNKLIF